MERDWDNVFDFHPFPPLGDFREFLVVFDLVFIFRFQLPSTCHINLRVEFRTLLLRIHPEQGILTITYLPEAVILNERSVFLRLIPDRRASEFS